MTTDIASTVYGRVQGRKREGGLTFLGIRYGAPTGGVNRFLPPQPPEPWSGIASATELGNIAPQFVNPRRNTLAPPSEDCLFLNVWTPETVGRRPVIVWIHGGGFSAGSGYSDASDGASISASEDVVVVSMNHRLSLLGFLHLEEVGGDEWGFEANPGLLDLVAALRWVRDNIENFGGDPERVMIQGHSGGGGKVASLLASPLAAGLFSSAAIHGGPPFGMKSPGSATLNARRVLDEWKVDGRDLTALQRLPLSAVMDAQDALGVGPDPTEHGMRFAPVTGTASLPVSPETAFSSGYASGIPLIVGTSIDEMRYIYSSNPAWMDPAFDVDQAELVRLISAGTDVAADSAVLVERYRALRGPGRNVDLLMEILSDQFFVRSARLATQKQAAGSAPVFSYLATVGHSTPLGTFHGRQMPLFFNNVGAGPEPVVGTEYERTARVLAASVAGFARTGDPNTTDNGEGLRWPELGKPGRQQLIVSDQGLSVSGRWLEERLSLWSGIAATSSTDPWGRTFEASARSRREVTR